MPWHLKKTTDMTRRWRALSERRALCIVAIAALTIFWLPLTHAEETETRLRWQNGDTLPGELQESNSETIRWASPYFLDDLVLDINVLDSVVFPKESNPATEAFRVSSVSGDVWIADLIGADDNTFLFSSKRHGQFRVKRSAVFKLERQGHLNYLFDGSQLTNWRSAKSAENIDDFALLIFHEPGYYDWHQDDEGRPQTNRKSADLFQTLKWPKYFEIDLALEFTEHPPNFVFALGKNLYQAFRLEVWSNKANISHLVAVQGSLFKTVLTIQPEQHNLRLRLTYDESAGMLRVFDVAANLLLELDGVKPTVQESGLYIQNKGNQGLKVRELKVYDHPVPKPTAQRVDLSKPHIHKMNRQVVQGKLFVQKDNAYALDTDGIRRAIDLQKVIRVIQPGPPSTASDVEAGGPVGAGLPVEAGLPSPYIKYPDKVILHGRITAANAERVMLQTAFAEAPIHCSLADATLLHFDTKPKTPRTLQNTVESKDRLFHTKGTLRGLVLFDGTQKGAQIRWEPEGALKPVRLANNRSAHIRRFLQPPSKTSGHFDTAQFPHALHLQTGETFPCHITGYDGKHLSFRSPVVNTRRIDAATIKALEFSDRTLVSRPAKTYPTRPIYSVGLRLAENGVLNRNIVIEVPDRNIVINEIELVKDGKKTVIKDFNADGKIVNADGKTRIIIPADALRQEVNQGWIVGHERTELLEAPQKSKINKNKLDAEVERALTVPRLNRDNPPNHILVANTDDMMRGQFLGFNGQVLQFDSKLRRFSIPIARVARVVDVKRSSRRQHEKPRSLTTPEVRVTLTDGSTLIFQLLEVQAGKLIGHSSVYGEVSVPVSSVEYLYFGEEAKSFKAAFEKWIVRPAKTPTDKE